MFDDKKQVCRALPHSADQLSRALRFPHEGHVGITHSCSQGCSVFSAYQMISDDSLRSEESLPRRGRLPNYKLQLLRQSHSQQCIQTRRSLLEVCFFGALNAFQDCFSSNANNDLLQFACFVSPLLLTFLFDLFLQLKISYISHSELVPHPRIKAHVLLVVPTRLQSGATFL